MFLVSRELVELVLGLAQEAVDHLLLGRRTDDIVPHLLVAQIECLCKQFVARLLGLGIELIVILAAAPAIWSIQPLRDKILEDRFPYFLANEL